MTRLRSTRYRSRLSFNCCVRPLYLSCARVFLASRPFQDTTFAAFMEGFNAAVGVPPERAGESVFTFDGDNLTPNGTPEVRRPSKVWRIPDLPPETLLLAYAHGV